MPAEAVGALFAAGSALAFGAGDFLGGAAARRSDPLRVAAVVQAVGLAALLLLTVGLGSSATGAALAFGAAAGVGGGVGLAALYRALRGGGMGVVTGLTGAVASLLALTADAALRWTVPSPIQLAGVACALGAAWIVTFGRGRPLSAGFIGPALVAGVAFGIFFVLLGRAAETSPLWGLVAARGAGTVILAGATWVHRGQFRPSWRPLVSAGLLDASANWLIVMALVLMPVGLATALSNANTPIVTMALASLLLHERLSRTGLIAVALACVGIALIAWA